MRFGKEVQDELNLTGKDFNHIKVEGRTGTWYATRAVSYEKETYLELESEQHGDEAEHIIVNLKTMGEPSEDLGYYLLFEAE
jgi:hypothetical protein